MGPLPFYLAHQERVAAYLRAEKADFETLREEAQRQHPSLYAKLDAAAT
jgi:hypothetical protein